MMQTGATWCYALLVFFGSILFHGVLSNNRCDNTVHRCPYGQTCLHYDRKSQLGQRVGSHAGYKSLLYSYVAANTQDRICLNAEGVCATVDQYSGHRYGHSGRYSKGRSEHCSSYHIGDGRPCSEHGQCKSIRGGIAICCNRKCVHVHNVPCVREFLREEDRHCDEDAWNDHFGSHTYTHTATPAAGGKSTARPTAPQTGRPVTSATTSRTTPLPGACGIAGNDADFDQFVNPAAPVTRIIGAETAVSKQLCWHVVIREGLCSGALIGSRTVVTSAWCVTDSDGDPTDPEDVSVGIGGLSSKITLITGCTEVYTASAITIHPSYDKNNLNNGFDIAVITLEEPIDFAINPCACTLCLKNKNPLTGETCAMSGTGREDPDSNDVDTPLQWMPVRALSKDADDCNNPTAIVNHTGLICSSTYVVEGQGVESGDSGDPLFCLDSETRSYYLAGIYSYGGFDADGARGALSTRVRSFLRFIIDNAAPQDTMRMF